MFYWKITINCYVSTGIQRYRYQAPLDDEVVAKMVGYQSAQVLESKVLQLA